ncbi:hypothetical protein [Hymenobacter mucosus]|uniref:Uncharacterized protein n=1 Tax=Hymenobacter mucosus TaxID=1411120 RepID=A0A239AYX4_9BACT|nr:hypothetical protein [Hymenobacter mucosus]SNS00936.1 hypothetical protein SAMN06269173_11659 [Hymenobacter mucosus]
MRQATFQPKNLDCIVSDSLAEAIPTMPVLDHDLDELFCRAATKYPEQHDTEACWLRLSSRLHGLCNSTNGMSLDWCLVDKPDPCITFRTDKDDETAK